MSEHIKKSIEELRGQLETKLAEVSELKKVINMLCKTMGSQPMFTDVEMESVGPGVRVRPDQFYGKSPIKAAREFLEMRGQASSAEEILDGLESGGFDIKGQGWNDKLKLRSLAISLAKNTAVFHRLPNQTYGLLAWYPNVKEKKQNKAKIRNEEVTDNTPPKEEIESGE